MLGPNVAAPSWSPAQVQTWLNDASTVLEKHLRIRLVVTEVVDLPDPHFPNSWFTVPDPLLVGAMELVAEYRPCDFAWRPDAINVYLVDRINGAGGVCSFPMGSSPTDNDLILMAPTSNSGGVALAHEIGHYLNLRHTHASFEGPLGGCPGGSCGDCVDDTWDDVDPSLCSGFACHNANLLALNYPAHAFELLRFNVMSYHGPLTAADARLSCGQVLRAWDGLRRFRSHVLAGASAPSLAAAAPAGSVYPGPVRVAVDGTNLPTTGSVEVGVGRVATGSLAVHTSSRVEAVFADPIEPGDLCVTLRQDGQLVAARSGLIRVTPSLVAGIDPAGPSLRAAVVSSAPATPMALLIGTPLLPAVAVPGVLFQLELSPVPVAVPVLTGPASQGERVFSLTGLASGASATFQGLELTAPPWRFTNAVSVAIP